MLGDDRNHFFFMIECSGKKKGISPPQKGNGVTRAKEEY